MAIKRAWMIGLLSFCCPVVATAQVGDLPRRASAPAKPTPGSTADSRPNIVLILADDLGYGDIGPYGQTKVETPYLDELARQGVRFTQHYAGDTVCAPSRAALITGRDSGHGQIRGNKELGDFTDEGERGQMPLATGTPTLPGMLKAAGYETALIGKWGLGMADTPGNPNAHGFDYAFGLLDQKQAHNYYPTHLWENGRRFALRNPFFIPHVPPGEPSQAADIYSRYQGRDYAPDRLIGKAEDYIAARTTDRPFFLYYAPTLPHAAMQIPYPLVARYKGRFPETPLDRSEYTPHPTPRAARAAMITRLDEEVGRIRAALERAGVADNTIIIFTSDNGPANEGGEDVDFFNASGGLRGMKRDMYEGGLRVPLIVAWPGHTKAGTTSDTISANWDFMPTLAAVAGARAPAPIEGRSFLPAILGEKQAQTGSLYWEFHESAGGGPVQAVRDGKWKAIRFQSGGFNPRRSIELYDLSVDPAERHDVASSNPAVVARLRQRLDSRAPSPVPGFNFEASAKKP